MSGDPPYEELLSRTLAGASEPSRTLDWELGIVCWAHPMEHRIRGFLDVCVDWVSGVPVWPMSGCLDEVYKYIYLPAACIGKPSLSFGNIFIPLHPHKACK